LINVASKFQVSSGFRPCFLLADVNATTAAAGYVNHSWPERSETALTTPGYVVMTTTSSSVIGDGAKRDSLQLVREVGMKVLGPVLVVNDASPAATAARQSYSVDVLFRHSSYAVSR